MDTGGIVDDVALFLVRVWRRRGAFRASVRGPGPEAPALFDDPAAVTDFLRRAGELPVAPTKGGPSDEREGN